MRKIYLCGHTGSINRGCEAIVRATVEVLKDSCDSISLVTFAPQQDAEMVKELGIEQISYGHYPTKLHRIVCGVIRRVNTSSVAGQLRYIQEPLVRKLEATDICLAIGGDTYCYSRPIVHIALNRYAYTHNIKNILWCCSVEKEAITKDIFNDLQKYSCIFAREQLTYDTLREAGILQEKVVKVCDPAFFLKAKQVQLPDGFVVGNTVGLNVSFMVVNKDNPIVYESILTLIRDILEKTDMGICLIPHVYRVEDKLQDYEILEKIKNEINDKRISMVTEEYTCEELKYIVSRCRLFVGARTHSTIAAYSTGVPTLVLGYSVKSRGIATDLFGTYEGYVLPYDEICDVNATTRAFWNIFQNEMQIRNRLETLLPEYRSTLVDAVRRYIDC